MKNYNKIYSEDSSIVTLAQTSQMYKMFQVSLKPFVIAIIKFYICLRNFR